MTILVKGTAGYIGSHTALQLLKQNYSGMLRNSLSNPSQKFLNKPS